MAPPATSDGTETTTCDYCGATTDDVAQTWVCQTCDHTCCDDCGGATQGDGRCDHCREVA